jgi:hypothetical protein
MTTIAQLPPVATVGPTDLLPLSQAGLLYSVTTAQLTAGLNPLITVPTGDLLGRQSAGAGAPEPITVGTGLNLSIGNLTATGADHADFPVQGSFSLSDELVINAGNTPALLPVTALRGLFSAGAGIGIDSNGVISVTVSAIAGPAGPQGATGPAGPAGPTGATGATGSGLAAPAAGNSASSIGASDYVAIWQNGATAWMPYGQFLGGQTIDQLPAAGPAADSDELLVAQGSNSLCVQGFGAIWNYVQAKLPIYQRAVVELTANTVLDSTSHNGRLLVASAALTLTANFTNMGPGFSCTLINLSAGAVTMGTGITSGTGTATLPPGASATFYGIAYSGGSLVWWSGVVANAPTITVATITAPAPSTAFTVSGGIFNEAPTALDYSTDGGTTWVAAAAPVIGASAYSFTAPGLTAGTYTLRVRDHANPAVIGVSNSFAILAPSISIGAVPAASTVNAAIAVTGAVSPGNAAVRVGLSTSAVTAPTVWQNATVSSGAWSVSLTPAAAGTVYVWAQQSAATGVQAVSAGISVVAASLSIAAPATGAVGAALSITGNVSPAADAVSVQLSTQNTTAPTSGWVAATSTAGSISASLTPSAAGTYYVWAKDATTGITAVSAAITVSALPATTYTFNTPSNGPFTHGVGTVACNGGISPADGTAVQVAFSTSNITPPTSGWTAATLLQGNTFWAVYGNTPSAAGAYYIWIETAAGADATVSSFTFTVS